MLLRPPRPTLFPYTTLFRSVRTRMSPTQPAATPYREPGAPPNDDGESVELYIETLPTPAVRAAGRSEEHTSELQSLTNLVCRLLLEKKKKKEHRSHEQHQPL